MSQRKSGYERKKNDLYETPEWVTRALMKHIPIRDAPVWEPAAGNGAITEVLSDYYTDVIPTDKSWGLSMDFLFPWPCPPQAHTIITNPPYGLAQEFIERALRGTEEYRGQVCMLLRTDFDYAKTRVHLFRDHPAFFMKIVLLKRIRWFPDSKGSPSFNHAWFVWDWRYGDSNPRIRYSI